jgi:hypothetical protein
MPTMASHHLGAGAPPFIKHPVYECKGSIEKNQRQKRQTWPDERENSKDDGRYAAQ